MIRILHAADLHLDALFRGLSPELAVQARREQLELPRRISELARSCGAQILLLSGDLFDRPQATLDSREALAAALGSLDIPVFIAPGNHDYFTYDSPYFLGKFPENVHIFTEQTISSLVLPGLNCRVYGAGYRDMDCPDLLQDFRRQGSEQYHILVLHGEVTGSPGHYCPVTRGEIAASNLSYLALGHNHTAGSVLAGATLCAWPGCPMGRGFDETGPKGVYLVDLTETGARAEFLPLGARAYYDISLEAGEDPAAALDSLPGDFGRDIYRVTFTGESQGLDLPRLQKALAPKFCALALRDATRPKADLWQTAGDDSLEGRYFALLRQAAEAAGDETQRRRLILAARLSRRILDGGEVELP